MRQQRRRRRQRPPRRATSEKIFHIPFWLRPMPLHATGRLLDVLTATHPSPGSNEDGDVDEQEQGDLQGPPAPNGPSRPRPAGDRAPHAFHTVPGICHYHQPSDGETRGESSSEDENSGKPLAYELRINSTRVTRPDRDFMHELKARYSYRFDAIAPTTWLEHLGHPAQC
jgi:hypothetical protein